MKLEFFDSDFYSELSISPETVAELTKLLRMVKNVKKEKPGIYLSFENDTPHLYVSFKKLERSKQIKSISK